MATYTEASVVSLASLEHIRLRAGMYIGRLGDGSQVEDGIYTLFKEVVDNAIDEFIMGYGKTLVIFSDDSTITVRDSGRGIPLGKMIECVSKINTGAKYTQDVFHFSVGLNGVGLKAVNALSEKFTVRSVRKKKYHYAIFHKGILQDSRQGSTKDPDGTEITFSPDPTIFTNFSFNDEFLRKKFVVTPTCTLAWRSFTIMKPSSHNKVFLIYLKRKSPRKRSTLLLLSTMRSCPFYFHI